ncbi:putative intracellular protein transport protein (Sat1) [Aspergillus undulatus]|uniref:putative intracellular protein transport protein (Sat1) n=1 Tax=Aspergillus undulatus TaxID=1810928 RepID=UPI003CCDCE16
MSSDIQVFVRWKDQSIFAGEDVECTITFKNVAEKSEDRKNAQTPHLRKQSRSAITPRSDSFSLRLPSNPFRNLNRRSYPITPRKSPSHRISSSVSSPLIGPHSFPPPSTPRNLPSSGHKHKRSISILSIDSEGGNSSVAGDKTPKTPSQLNPSRPVRGHGRSASLQVVPRRYEGYEGAKSLRSPIRGFPSSESPIQPIAGGLRVDTDVPKPGGTVLSPIKPSPPVRAPGRRPQLPPIDFKFPPAPESETGLASGVSPATASTDKPTDTSAVGRLDARGSTSSLAAPGQMPQSKILSASSLSGSHRSSGEFYSVSNNSTETLQSEYTNYSGPIPRAGFPRHSRHMSSVVSATPVSNAQALLMGYAQISASFTVDGSLINQSAFEEVKRQGVVGGAGGGSGTPNGRPASSSGKSRKGGGFWGALNWNSIEESISGLLSNNDLDGLRDMRGVSSSKSIPLLSTPQSLLFVDLRLAPGEEESFSFSFTLPSGLPASHKGKALKISYNLIIGTQRPSGSNEPQKVNRISIPFRVFSGVNGQGNILGHDLMRPYVILRDEARVQKVGSTPQFTAKTESISRPTWTSAPEFLSYVDEILEQRSRNSSLKPPGTLAERRSSLDSTAGPLSCKDAIDFAILRSNQAINSSQSPNRFEIARGGRRIAVVVLNRPAHRLGETLIATVNLADSALPCYALRATLESSEKVGAHLAVRSGASIRRATRRVHASFFEITLYSTRVVFSPAIPISATPTILTSGVNVEWELRFEFVTSSVPIEMGSGPSGANLLETVSRDDRGSAMSALENLGCESFEVAIPITIYGETVRERLPEENEGHSI